jgi:glutathione S-transferase
MMATGFAETNKSGTLDRGEGSGIEQGEATRKAEPEAQRPSVARRSRPDRPRCARAALCAMADPEAESETVLTLFSYPELFGVADNNPYGLKIFAFLKLCGLPFRHQHIFDASSAPRGQLPYIDDDGEIIGDSDRIIAHLIRRNGLTIDDALTAPQRDVDLMVRRLLDDLYWVMSYSRWRDDAYWPLFRDEILKTHANVSAESLERAREYNFQRYYYQGIGRYDRDAAFARGLADLEVLAKLVPEQGFPFGPQPTSIDAAIYGFIANIYFFKIETPLRAFVASHANLVRHCETIHKAASA